MAVEADLETEGDGEVEMAGMTPRPLPEEKADASCATRKVTELVIALTKMVIAETIEDPDLGLEAEMTIAEARAEVDRTREATVILEVQDNGQKREKDRDPILTKAVTDLVPDTPSILKNLAVTSRSKSSQETRTRDLSSTRTKLFPKMEQTKTVTNRNE